MLSVAENILRNSVFNINARKVGDIISGDKIVNSPSGKQKKKMRVLFMSASPRGVPKIDPTGEYDVISRLGDYVQSEALFSSTALDVAARVRSFSPDVLHIASHGLESAIVLVNRDGTENAVGYDVVREILSVSGGSVRCLILSGCKTQVGAEYLLPFVKECSVGTMGDITDAQASVFSEYFYRLVSVGTSFGDAVNLANSSLDGSNLFVANLP